MKLNPWLRWILLWLVILFYSTLLVNFLAPNFFNSNSGDTGIFINTLASMILSALITFVDKK